MSRATGPGLSVVTPTQGRETLGRLLDSVAGGGLGPRDEHIVVIDGHGLGWGEAERIDALVTAYGPRWRTILHDAGGHSWGHCELNVGIEAAREGNYLVFNDDDDVFAPDAFSTIRAAIAEDTGTPRLHIFRFMPPWRSPLPEGRQIARGRIGGHCIVTPNLPGMTGRFGADYEGDYTYIEQTVALWGGPEACVFHDAIIAICRPS